MAELWIGSTPANRSEASRAPGYFAEIDIRLGTTTAGATVALWAMRNLSTTGKNVYIRRIRLMCSSTVTTAAATTQYYALQRFTAATPTSGTAIVVVKKKSTYPATVVTDIRDVDAAATAGLTTTSLVFGASIHLIAVPRQLAVTRIDLDYSVPNQPGSEICLIPNDGLAIVLAVTNAVSGDQLVGSIEWDEATQ